MQQGVEGNHWDYNLYYPYGCPTRSIYSDRYMYSGKELDNMNGLRLYDFPARPYDAISTRFLSPDPLRSKYPHISPYAYCANNPIMFIDPTGMDICVLLQPDGAMGAGHMAILIQNEDGSWSLWSKNGTDENLGIKGAPSDENSEKKNQKGVGPFKSIEEFFESTTNKYDTNTKSGKYTIGYLIQSTKEENLKKHNK